MVLLAHLVAHLVMVLLAHLMAHLLSHWLVHLVEGPRDPWVSEWMFNDFWVDLGSAWAPKVDYKNVVGQDNINRFDKNKPQKNKSKNNNPNKNRKNWKNSKNKIQKSEK